MTLVEMKMIMKLIKRRLITSLLSCTLQIVSDGLFKNPLRFKTKKYYFHCSVLLFSVLHFSHSQYLVTSFSRWRLLAAVEAAELLHQSINCVLNHSLPHLQGQPTHLLPPPPPSQPRSCIQTSRCSKLKVMTRFMIV